MGAVAALVGGALGAGAALRVYYSEQHQRERAELGAALEAIAISRDLMVAELRRTAPPHRNLRRLSRALDRHLPAARWLAQPLTDALWHRPSHLTDRFFVAVNRVVAVAPQSLLSRSRRPASSSSRGRVFLTGRGTSGGRTSGRCCSSAFATRSEQSRRSAEIRLRSTAHAPLKVGRRCGVRFRRQRAVRRGALTRIVQSARKRAP